MSSYHNARQMPLKSGDTAPTVIQRTARNDRYALDTAAGRWIVLGFLGNVTAERRRLSGLLMPRRLFFDDQRACFFGVSTNQANEAEGVLEESYPGIRYFRDFDQRLTTAFGLDQLPEADRLETAPGGAWVILDPQYRIHEIISFTDDHNDLISLHRLLDRLPPPDRLHGFEMPAPVMIVPNVFEPAFCKKLTDLYTAHGGTDSGFMREVDGRTVGLIDYTHKRRSDYIIEEDETLDSIQSRISRRLVPQIARWSNFQATRMERYIVACYRADESGHFRPHRDNTTAGTAHRRFAVTINLNADFDGGELRFPEFGRRTYKPPLGAGLVFGCSLLHEVVPVTRGVRYAFLPFLYDDAAATIRASNQHLLGADPGAGLNAEQATATGQTPPVDL